MKLSHEDEQFRQKILDLHRKLSDVACDEESLAKAAVAAAQEGNLTPRRLRELEMVVKRAEEKFERNAKQLEHDEDKARKLQKKVEFDDAAKLAVENSDSNFRLRLRKRGVKLLGFLGASKSQDGEARVHEARLVRMCSVPETNIVSSPSRFLARNSSGPNTISVQHSSRDRRFWRLRNRRRSSST